MPRTSIWVIVGLKKELKARSKAVSSSPRSPDQPLLNQRLSRNPPMLRERLTVVPMLMSLEVSKNLVLHLQPPNSPKIRLLPRRNSKKRLPLPRSDKMRLIASVLLLRKRLRRRKLIRSVQLKKRLPKKLLVSRKKKRMLVRRPSPKPLPRKRSSKKRLKKLVSRS